IPFERMVAEMLEEDLRELSGDAAA
ncbi:MAG: hypothetical protein JWM31_427, partial [Solirubrobacterales bacterium]|nr:hypothetical protein [Solirubrobacterales bacterium]